MLNFRALFWNLLPVLLAAGMSLPGSWAMAAEQQSNSTQSSLAGPHTAGGQGGGAEKDNSTLDLALKTISLTQGEGGF